MKQILIVLCAFMVCTILVPHDAFAKKLTINLSESLDMSTNDKKPKDTDVKKDTNIAKKLIKPAKKTEPQKKSTPPKTVKEVKKPEPKKKIVKETKKIQLPKNTKLQPKHETVKKPQ